MWVPLFESILRKTLLKWPTPQSNKQRATKFKTKNFNNSIVNSTAACIVESPTTTPATTTAAALLTTTTITKQYRVFLALLVFPVLSFLSLVSSSSFVSSLSASASASTLIGWCASFLIAQFLLRTVIKRSPFLMNDIRTKSLYSRRSTASSSSSSSNSPSSSSTIDSKLFNNNYKNNHRTYNNSSKSNKVFLHYTPRDPRLRIFNNQFAFNKHSSLAKNNASSDNKNKSELKITEDLCNYGELIGGYSVDLRNTLNNYPNNNNNNNNYKSDKSVCDLNDSEHICIPQASEGTVELVKQAEHVLERILTRHIKVAKMVAKPSTQSRQNGSIYQNLPSNSNGPPPQTVATTTTPLNKSIKHDLFPEVTFCNLLTDDLDDGDPNSRMLKNSVITIDGANTVAATTSAANGNDVKKRTRLISNDSGDSIDSNSTEKKKPEIPDGGYGWVVVFASLVVSLIADGLSFSFGLINTELLAYFKESPSKTAWISSLFFSVPLLMGPIWSNLVDKYGCRKMTILGGLVSAFGFGLASLCNSIEMLMLTFGIISGLGLGIGYVTAVVSIAFWFDKKRTFATGIGASGTGIGTFLYAPLTQYLIDSYGWRGATLILAGTMLNACVMGALMRDPDWLIEENRLESRSQSVTTFSNSSVCLEEIKKLLDTGITKEAVLDTLVTKNNTEANQQIGDPMDNSLKRYRSEIFLPTFLGSQELDSIYEVKSLSRRSLRHKEGVEAPSRENLLSMSSTGATANPTATFIGSPDDTMMGGIAYTAAEAAKKSYLASIETLSPSEKRSEGGRQTPMRTSLGSLLSSTDEGYLTQKFSREQNHDYNNYANSRYSLNENLFAAKNTTPSLSNLKLNGLRHNSVDILSEDLHNCYLFSTKDDATSALLEANVRRHNEVVCAGPAVITIPENAAVVSAPVVKRTRLDSITGMRRLSKSKKPSYQRSNLRRNISIRNSNYLKDMRLHRTSINYRGAMLNTHRYRLRASSCPNIYRNSMTTIAKEDEDTWYDNLIDTMKSVFDFSLFADTKFTLFNLSTLFLFIWFIIPYLYLPEYMKNYGYQTADSASLISTIGIAQTIGMIGLGYIGDRPWMNINVCYSVCMLFCGLSVFLMPLLVTSYNGLLLLCILFGFTFASSFSFTPSILVSIVDLEDFTCGYGLVLLVQGVGMIAGPPIAGAIYETTLRWDDAFYFAGVFIALSGVTSYLIEFCEKRPKDGKESDSDVSDSKKGNAMH